MNTDKNTPAAIHIEETHIYDIELAEISTTIWQKAEGSIRVWIPYDGTVFKEDASHQEIFHVGNLLVTQQNGNVSEIFSIDIEAGEKWWEYIKSGKRAVCQAKYTVSPPKETLVSIQGAVLDFTLLNDNSFNNTTAFQNPLRLQLDLWLPDMSSDGLEEEETKLEKMILQREHAQQIFMQHTGNFGQQLAPNLVALANSYGGTLFIGVDKKGKITGLSFSDKDKIPGIVLEAALKATPPIRLRQVELHRMANGHQVYVITVPQKNTGITHSLEGKIYKRQKKETVSESSGTPATETDEVVLVGKSLDDLVELDEEGRLHPRNDDNVAFLYGATGVKSLSIGRYICAMINASLSEAHIVIRGLSHIKQKDIESHLKNELAHFVPPVPQGVVELIERDDQVIALITVPIGHIPAALYQGEGFIWEEKRAQSISQANLLNKYIAKYSTDLGQHGLSDVQLKSAWIHWPIRPAEKLNGTSKRWIKKPDHNVQRHALTWQPASFIKDEAFGYNAVLNLPLINASLTVDENGEISSQQPIVTGQIEINFEGIIASGLNVVIEDKPLEDEESENESYLHSLPVIKHTRLNLNLTVRLSEIFRHQRPQQSLLHFFLSDTLLDMDRARDVVLACADSGFRLYNATPEPNSSIPEVDVHNYEHLENGRILIEEAWIKGIRNYRYHDIHLILGLRCLPSHLTREKQYEDVHDTSQIKSFSLEVVIVLQGKGEDVGQEISRLQLRLFELLQQRVQKLGTA